MNTDLPGPDAASGGQGPPLNYYGELVRRQCEGCLPEVYQQIRDPGAFFAVLGEVIAKRIDEHIDDLAGDDPPGEGYLVRVARLTAARDRAQERVLGEIQAAGPGPAGGGRSRPPVMDAGRCRAAGTARRSARRGGPAMTALANSPLFWTGLLARPGGFVCPAHHDRRDQAR